MIYLALLLLFISLANGSEDEYRLIQDLKNDYDPIERPVSNHKKALDVNLRIYLQQILEVDEKNQMITVVVWLQTVSFVGYAVLIPLFWTWHDYKMVWLPDEYGNITNIALPSEMLWRPDLLLFNSADENFDARFAVNFVVDNKGNVMQAPPAIVKSSCLIDITWFPFGLFSDNVEHFQCWRNKMSLLTLKLEALYTAFNCSFSDAQLCYLKLGSWTYSGSKINLNIDSTDIKEENHKMDVKYYVVNGAWDLLGTPAKRITSGFGEEMYIELYYYIHIQRKVIYYGINWIIPSILFLFGNILGFSLPSECGEKITLQTTNLLSVTVFLGMVAEVTPPTSTSVPFIGAFFALQMVLLGSSVIITVLVINVSFRSPKTHKMSSTMRRLFLEWLPWLTLMTRPGTKFHKPKSKSASSGCHSSDKASEHSSTQSGSTSIAYKREAYGGISHLIKGNSNASLLRFTRALSGHQIVPSEQTLLHPLNERSDSTDVNTIIERSEQQRTMDILRETLIQLSEFLRESKQKMIDEEQEESEQADWRFMAMAIDRGCMFLYAILSIVIPVSMYLSTPKYDNIVI